MTLVAEAPVNAETLTLTDCLDARGIDTLAASPTLRAKVATAGIPEAALAASTAGLRKAFQEALRIPIGEIFKAASVRLSIHAPDYIAPQSDNAPATLALAPMVVESSHHPTIAVNCDGVGVSLRFDVELTLEVSGAELLIEHGRVIGARTGTTSGIAHVSYLTATVVELGSPKFELPGELRFSRPVATTAAET